MSAAQRAEARRAAGVRAVRSLPVGFQLVRVEEGTSTAQAAAALERRGGVRSVEPNYSGYRPLATPNDPFFTQGRLWGLHNDPLSVGLFGGFEDADIDAPEAWELARGSSDVVVAVVDTGIQLGHPELSPRLWRNPGEVPGDGVDNDGNGKIDDVHGWNINGNNAVLTDSNGHGTHVAGTIGAAGNNGVGLTGVAWDSRLMVVKVLDPTASDAQVAEAFDYAARHAHIVNASLGREGPASSAVDAVIAAHPDTLFVFAAGNDKKNVESVGSVPCQSPGINVICVAATDPSDTLASFSNYGAASVDLAAPGVSILSTYSRRTLLTDTFEDGVLTDLWTVNGGWAIDEDEFGKYASITGTAGTLTLAGAVNTRGRSDCQLAFDGYQSAPNLARVETTTDGTTWTTAFTFFTVGDWQIYDVPLPSAILSLRFVSAGGGTVSIDTVQLTCAAASREAVYAYANGTSMAAPHVSGAAAVLLSARPSATIAELRAALLDHGDPLPSLAGVTVTGRRLNLFASLRELMEPGVTTGAATVTGDRVRLAGSVKPNAKATEYAFEWGATPALGNRTARQSAGDGVDAVDVAAELEGLAAGTTYHYRLVAYRGETAHAGETRTFTTAPAPAPEPEPSPPATPGPGDGANGPASQPTRKVNPPRRLGSDAKVTCTARYRRKVIRSLSCRVTGKDIRKVRIRLVDRRGRTVAIGTGKPRRAVAMRRRGVRRGRYTAKITVVGPKGRTVVVKRTVRV